MNSVSINRARGISKASLALAIGATSLVVAFGAASAPGGSGGAQIFTTDGLNAFASTSEGSISVFAQRQGPLGTSGFAVINAFLANEFVQCTSSSLDITVLPTGAKLAFVGDEGFNCPIGTQVLVKCDVTSNSAILHNVTNGTAKLPIFNQQYTTHGTQDTYNDLTCEISALGFDAVSDGGSAGTSRSTTTP